MFVREISNELLVSEHAFQVTIKLIGEASEFEHMQDLIGRDITTTELFNDEIQWLRENKEKLDYILHNMELSGHDKECLERLTMEVT